MMSSKKNRSRCLGGIWHFWRHGATSSDILALAAAGEDQAYDCTPDTTHVPATG
jgi:hypothetical protein